MSLLPRSLFSRLVLVLLGGLLTAQLLSFAIHMHDRSELLMQASGMQSAQRIADIVNLLDTLTPPERQKIVKVLAAPPLAVSLDRPPLAPADADSESGARAVLFASLLRRFLGEDRNVVVGMAVGGPSGGAYPGGGAMRGPGGTGEWTPPMMRHGGGPGAGGLTFVAQVALRDGTRVTFDARQPQATENWPYRVLLSIALLLAAVIGVSLIAVRDASAENAGGCRRRTRQKHQPPAAGRIRSDRSRTRRARLQHHAVAARRVPARTHPSAGRDVA